MSKKLPIHIFIVSTDKTFTNQMVQNLEIETDYFVFQYSSGEEFSNDTIYNPIPPNAIPIIIVDYELKSLDRPDAKDGLTILSEIKSEQPRWQVITFSDSSLKKVKNDALALGAYCHIFKNENTFARLKAKIHEIENEEAFKKQKKITFYAILSFLGITLILLLVAFLLYIFEQ